jgi:hypothetical protein
MNSPDQGAENPWNPWDEGGVHSPDSGNSLDERKWVPLRRSPGTTAAPGRRGAGDEVVQNLGFPGAIEAPGAQGVIPRADGASQAQEGAISRCRRACAGGCRGVPGRRRAGEVTTMGSRSSNPAWRRVSQVANRVIRDRGRSGVAVAGESRGGGIWAGT